MTEIGSQSSRSTQIEFLSTDSGLSQSTVLALEQDRFGYMWIGTQSGLNRYDGETLKIFQHDTFDPESLSFRTILAIHAADDGSIWVGTSIGLNRMDPYTEKFRRFSSSPDNPNTLSHNNIRAITSGPDGTIWVGTSNGLNRIAPESNSVSRISGSASTDVRTIHAVHADRDGTVWVGTGSGLARIRPTDADSLISLELQSADRGPIDLGAVTSMAGDDASLWVAGTRGLYRVDRSTLIAVEYLFDRSLRSEPMAIKADPQNPAVLWVGAESSGLYRLETISGRAQKYDFQPFGGLFGASERIRSIFVDFSGIVWTGMESSGVARFDPDGGGFEHITAGGDSFPDHRFVATIHEDAEGGLWTGTMNPGLLTRLDRVSGQRSFWQNNPGVPSSLSAGRINAILSDSRGDIWVGTDITGLNRMSSSRDGRFRHYRHDASDPGSLTSDSLTIVHEDQNGNIWAAFYFLGILDRYDPETDSFVHYELGPGNRYSGSVYGFFEDRDGLFWVTSTDLILFDPDSGEVIKRFGHRQNDQTSYSGGSSGVYKDEDGIVWVSSLQGGLSRLDPDTEIFTHYTPSNSDISDNEVYHVFGDSLGYVWMSSNRGLSRFNPRTESFVNYTQGLQGLEFTTFSAFKSPRTGELFFGGVNGVSAFFPHDFRANSVPPRVVLTEMKLSHETLQPSIDGILSEPLRFTSSISLNYQENDFSLDFAALHFKSPSENEYAYKLEPYDNEWTTTGIPTANYTNLDPDKYRFWVKASNSDGVWSEEVSELTIDIRHPWWQIHWVQWMAAIAAIGLLFTGFRIRVRSIQTKAARLQSLVTERTAEVKEQRDQLEEQADRLTEMNELKSRFFANISHEFRTPLTLTFGPIEDALSGRYSSLEEARPHFERARRNGGRLLRLINQLLDLSRFDSGMQDLQLVKLDMAQKLRQIAALFESIAQTRNIQFGTHITDENTLHIVDPDKLEKIVVNLLSNAFKFTASGGKVDLTLTSLDDGAIEIAVSDTGQGIPEEYLPKLFDRFYQVESQSTRGHEGSGIGLSLVKELVDLHEGTVDVESKTGFGTRFIVVLPRLTASYEEEESVPELPKTLDMSVRSEEVAAVPEAAPADSVSDENDSIILIVEDNADMLAYIRAQLEHAFSVLEGKNGSEGLSLALEHVPDLILSDVMMPEMDGIELCRSLKTDDRTSHIPIILLTARADVEDRIKGFESGADAYMPKPFDATELIVRVEQLIAERARLQVLFASQGTGSPKKRDERLADGLSSRELDFIERVQLVVEANIANPGFGVDQMSDDISMSRRQLLRKLRALTNESPVTLIRRLRMEKAAEMLRGRDVSIKEVCFAVGSQSSSSFTRTFRTYHGVSPSEFLESQFGGQDSDTTL